MDKKVYHFTKNDSMLRQIIDRRSVADSNKEVIKYAISRMAKGWETYNTMDRESKKRFKRAVISIHKDNIDLYKFVQRWH